MRSADEAQGREKAQRPSWKPQGLRLEASCCGCFAAAETKGQLPLGLQRGGKFPVNFRKVSSKFPWEVKLGNFGNIPNWKLSMGIMEINGNYGNLWQLRVI